MRPGDEAGKGNVMNAYVYPLSFSEKIKRVIKRVLRPLLLAFYIPLLKCETWIYNRKMEKRRKAGVGDGPKKKNLYFVSAGAPYKHLVARVIERFGHEDFDYLIVSYDGTRFDDEVFKRCRVIYEPGLTFKFVKKYITPDFGERYAHIFLWDDDIDVRDFDYKNFLEIFRRNNLQIAQPSLTHDSYYSFKLTLKDLKQPVGRYTDMVEIMAPVVRGDCWPAYWGMIEDDYNHWGFGYDSYARSFCGFKNMGIVDRETVAHVKPLMGETFERRTEYERLKKKLNRYMLAKIISYGRLK